MKQVALLAFNDALATSISLPSELLTAANSVSRLDSRKAIISSEFVGLNRQPISVSGGMEMLPSTDINNGKEYDLIIIPSRWRHPHRGAPTQPDVQRWLRSHEARGAEICAVGNGSYFLAEAGLLDGRVATTHWHYFDDFAARYPNVALHRDYLITQADNIFVPVASIPQPIWSFISLTVTGAHRLPAVSPSNFHRKVDGLSLAIAIASIAMTYTATKPSHWRKIGWRVISPTRLIFPN